jgi:hypothetical protein
MMPQEDLAKLAQQLRQAAQAELIAIRNARMAKRQQQDPKVAIDVQPRAAQGTYADRPRRLRKAKRLADLHRRMQEARLAAAMDAGLIELWAQGGQVGPSQGRAPGLIDHCPQENFVTVMQPPNAVRPDASGAQQPLCVFLGPPLPLFGPAPTLGQVAPLEPQFIGPALHEVAALGGEHGQGPDDQGRVQGDGDSNLAGCDAQCDDAARQAECALAVGASDLPLTLSTMMRVSQHDEAAKAQPGAETAIERVLMPAVTEGSQGLLAPDQFDMKVDLASGQDRLVAALQQARPTGPRNDLSSLPGAGPGLIWMLQKCGIASLKDLAGADPAILVPRLGLVGKIVNVQSWQRYAQRQVAHLS